MSSDPIIFYDLPSKDPCKAWSLNPWKTRALLNYKALPYKTEWVEYPDIEPKFREHVQPHKEGTSIANYTIPVVQLPDGQYLMDSFAIAKQLESSHSTPSLHLDSPYLERVMTLLPRAAAPLAPVFVPRVQREILNPPSAEYFKRTREARFGKSLEELAKGADEAWETSKPHIKELAAMLKEDDSGPYFMGKEVSYADFVLVSWMKMFDRIGQMGPILAVDDKAFGTIYEACKKWFERDNH